MISVDNIAQALRTDTSHANVRPLFAGGVFLYALHQFGGKEAVRTKRQRQTDMTRLISPRAYHSVEPDQLTVVLVCAG